jgi:serine/threonine protein kinase
MTARCSCRSGRPHPGVPARGRDCGLLLAGRYRLAERVGRGGTADVWRALDELLDRDVAVKRFRERYTHGVVEARLAVRVRHSNVATIHDLIRDRASFCIVMDYHKGTDLAAMLRLEHRLPPSIVAALGVQLLAALEAVHGAGVVHCDVKPANLVLSRDGKLVLVDFGIAESSGGELTHPARRNRNIIGTPAYMAPELVRGEAPWPSADLWSLGVVLYAAVEGHLPFRNDEVAPALTAVLHDPPRPARRAGRLQPVLEQLLVKDPAARPSLDAVRAMLIDAFPATVGPVAATDNGSVTAATALPDAVRPRLLSRQRADRP